MESKLCVATMIHPLTYSCGQKYASVAWWILITIQLFPFFSRTTSPFLFYLSLPYVFLPFPFLVFPFPFTNTSPLSQPLHLPIPLSTFFSALVFPSLPFPPCLSLSFTNTPPLHQFTIITIHLFCVSLPFPFLPLPRLSFPSLHQCLFYSAVRFLFLSIPISSVFPFNFLSFHSLSAFPFSLEYHPFLHYPYLYPPFL